MGFMVLHGIEWDDMLLEWGSMGLFVDGIFSGFMMGMSHGKVICFW
jgi:hypothetical protein